MSPPRAAPERIESLASTLTDVRQGLAAQEDASAPQRLDELARELASLRDSQAPDPQTIDRLAEDLDRAAGPARGGIRDTRAQRRSARPRPARGAQHGIEALASPSPAAPDGRIDQLVHDLETIREQLAKVERTPVTDPVVASELDTLSQRLRFLDDRLNEDVATSPR